MNKEAFLLLTRNYTSLTQEEAGELFAMQKEFPYCQVIKNLAARSAQDNQMESAQQQLYLSAIYSTDRAVLKSIMSAPASFRRQYDQPPEAITVPNTLSGDDLINEVMTDLARLQELKHNFEITIQEYDQAVHAPASQVPAPKKEPPVRQNQSKSEIKVQAESKPATPPPPRQKKTPEIPVEVPVTELIIEEIKTSKKKITPENPKQKEQLEIIDKFIKKQPSITKNSLPAIDSPDLSEKNTALTDSIVSETLVEILLRQGKKDKAIEMLKKLIWKFPQKKSIFAAQIEELRK